MSEVGHDDIDVVAAVRIAKAYVAQAFAGEPISNIGLEETEFDEVNGEWNITIGFSRPWEKPRPGKLSHIGMFHGDQKVVETLRAYKKVQLSRDGTVKGMFIRPIP